MTDQRAGFSGRTIDAGTVEPPHPEPLQASNWCPGRCVRCSNVCEMLIYHAGAHACRPHFI